MTQNNYSNVAEETALAANCSSVATAIAVSTTTGFPASTPFTLALDADAGTEELVSVTNVSGTTLTVTRGYDGTSAQGHSTGAKVRHVHAAIDFRLSRQHESATSAVHGVTGGLVGTTDTQSLTHKDLTSGTNSFPSSLATDSEVASATGAAIASANAHADAGDATTLTSANTHSDAAVATHAALTTTHGIAGAIVGTTDTQTLTNKTLDSPVVTGVGQKLFVLKTVNEARSSSTSLADDGVLTLAIPAAGTWVVDLVAGYQSTAAKLKIGVNWTGTGTIYTHSTGWNNVITDNSGSGPGLLFETYDVDGSEHAVIQTYTIVATSSGTAKVQWGQATSNATATSVNKGSRLRAERVA